MWRWVVVVHSKITRAIEGFPVTLPVSSDQCCLHMRKHPKSAKEEGPAPELGTGTGMVFAFVCQRGSVGHRVGAL